MTQLFTVRVSASYLHMSLHLFRMCMMHAARCGLSNGQLRLVGSSYREGRVDVCMNGQWGVICNSQVGTAEALCFQLGFPAQGIYI